MLEEGMVFRLQAQPVEVGGTGAEDEGEVEGEVKVDDGSVLVSSMPPVRQRQLTFMICVSGELGTEDADGHSNVKGTLHPPLSRSLPGDVVHLILYGWQLESAALGSAEPLKSK